jgi:hypothetical protein
MELEPGALYDSYWVLRNLAPRKADIHKKYLDIQDRAAREYIQENYYKYAQKEGPEYAFKVTENGVELTPDTNTPIQTHHPIWVVPAGKDTLTIGHLSDVHVSSKQHAYKGRAATVIPGADVLVSPIIQSLHPDPQWTFPPIRALQLRVEFCDWARAEIVNNEYLHIIV